MNNSSRAIKVTLDSVVSRASEPMAAEVGSEVILMSVQHGNYYGLDGPAGDIWRHMESPVRVADLCRRLEGDYVADPNKIEEETLAFLDRLAEEGLISIA